MSKADSVDATGVLPRAVTMLRKLAEVGPAGMRLADLADSVGMPRASAHRILKTLVAEQLVGFEPSGKRYMLGLDFFSLAARAGNPHGLRSLCRPTLLRLTESFGDTFFLLVRDGYHAMCIDRSHGSHFVRSLTEDIGGRVLLGQGQGALAILAFLDEDEQDEIIRHVISQLRLVTIWDEISLRARLVEVRKLGFVSGKSTLNAVTAGIGVPIFDSAGRAVAALSIAGPPERLSGEREAIIVDVLRREAAEISAKLNPFDPALRHAAAGLVNV